MEDIFAYDKIVNKMRNFFRDRNFIEIPAQSRRSILAACEDPSTISQYIFSGINWPLPQTGQMWLEKELLEHSDLKGVYCITTSYRNEPFPIEGRHDKIFPMFEFEAKGNLHDLIILESDLLYILGFKGIFAEKFYENICEKYGADVLEDEHELLMQQDYGNIVFLERFPLRTHPFWNMKRLEGNDDLYQKVDVLLHGMETIGSAERSTNVDEMREGFYTISDGNYAKLLFNHFGRKRVEDELEEYFSYDMFPRYGAGIGVTRMARAMKLEGLI